MGEVHVRGDPKNSRNSTPSSVVIPTGGEVFDDGTVIEVIEDLSQPGGLALLKWNRHRATISPRIVHRGQTYVALTLDPSVRRALRMPSSCSDFVPTATLFEELVAVAAKFTDLAERFRERLIFFVLASWLPDCLPCPINLSLWSPTPAVGAQILILLHCLCRSALLLTGVNASDLRALPDGLPATLLILRPASGRRTNEFLSASGWREFRMARSGRLVEILGAKALSTDAPLNDRTLGPMIQIPVSPSMRSLPKLDHRAQQELAAEFLPKLLRFRLRRCGAVRGEAATDPAEGGSVAPVSQLTSGLRACFSDEPELRDRQISLLVEAEQNGHGARRTDPRVLVIEVLWSLCHESGREKAHVAEIAADVNHVLSLKGDLELEDRMVGSVLKSLGLLTSKLDRTGRGLKLDPPTRKIIHQLARVHRVPSAETPFAGCPECSLVQPAGS
jgi:hypothetical protein